MDLVKLDANENGCIELPFHTLIFILVLFAALSMQCSTDRGMIRFFQLLLSLWFIISFVLLASGNSLSPVQSLRYPSGSY